MRWNAEWGSRGLAGGIYTLGEMIAKGVMRNGNRIMHRTSDLGFTIRTRT